MPIPGYKQLTRAVRAHDTRIFAQLNHNGQQCRTAALSGCLSGRRHPSGRALPRDAQSHGDRGYPRSHRLLARSAVNVREGGFDGAELQFGHSSLARQFMSPLTNFRGDEYMGAISVTGCAFHLEVVAAVGRPWGLTCAAGGQAVRRRLVPGD